MNMLIFNRLVLNKLVLWTVFVYKIMQNFEILPPLAVELLAFQFGTYR